MIEPKRNYRDAITTAVMLEANRKMFLKGNAGGLKCKIPGQPVRIIVLLLPQWLYILDRGMKD